MTRRDALKAIGLSLLGLGLVGWTPNKPKVLCINCKHHHMGDYVPSMDCDAYIPTKVHICILFPEEERVLVGYDPVRGTPEYKRRWGARGQYKGKFYEYCGTKTVSGKSVNHDGNCPSFEVK